MHIQLQIVSKFLLFVNFRGSNSAEGGTYQLADMYRRGLLAFYPSARAPVCQSAGSFAKAPVCQSASLPERQFCPSASFARAQVSPERQFPKVRSVLPERQFSSFARAPVLPERQFCQTASFARAPVS